MELKEIAHPELAFRIVEVGGKPSAMCHCMVLSILMAFMKESHRQYYNNHDIHGAHASPLPIDLATVFHRQE
jgi:hypothetical protein